MKKYKIIIYLVAGFAFPLKAQLFNAGPDRTICSETGVDLGTNAEIPSSWCITWSPKEGLDDIHSARPHANPKKDTKYIATVLTDSWESISTDEVLITVGFGGIKFNPPYLNQGSTQTVQATVTINPANEAVTWAFDGDSLGCMLNKMTGVIGPGSEYGTIKIKAFKTDHPACQATETIDINEGVKDLTARDANHPGRIAKSGSDTLYLVGEHDYIVTAIPNENGFPPGLPAWYNDQSGHAVIPEDGDASYTGSVFAEDHYSGGSAAAGYQPKVVIKRFPGDEAPVDLSPVIEAFTERISEVNDKITELIHKKFPQAPSLHVDVNVGSITYKTGKAEKYNNPGWDNKYTVEVGGTLALSGRVNHPQFTQMFDGLIIDFHAASELYLEPFFEASLTGSVNKDPSTDNPNWTLINPIKASVGGGIRGVFTVMASTLGYGIQGGFSLTSKIGFDLTFDLTNGEMKFQTTINPLQGNTKVVISHVVDPKKEWTVFDYTVDLLDKWTSQEYLLFDFGAQN
ncbi:MAG TPA: hypothetical protein VFG10_13765 [Saprospiraceae bacterium]|nr:hypothetical protein [Saprospiraceae bacterium]